MLRIVFLNEFPHTVSAGSGLGSGRACRIVEWNDARTNVFRNDYPFVGGRTPESMNWVCVEFTDGTLNTFPANRIIYSARVKQVEA